MTLEATRSGQDHRPVTLFQNCYAQYVGMQHLTANWKVLDEIIRIDGHNSLYILQKLE